MIRTLLWLALLALRAAAEQDEARRHLAEILERVNGSAQPCEDFFEFACGNWAQRNPPPQGSASWNGELKVG